MNRPGKLIALIAASLLAASAQAATVIYSNDVLGEIEPCGCRSNPLGGMDRKATLLSTLDDQELLLLDAGDLLFETDNIPTSLVKQSELQAKYLLKSMDVMGHHIVVPGERDFTLGMKTFDRLRKPSKIKFLAANLAKKDGGKYLESYAVFKRKTRDGKTIRIGVIGFVGEALRWPKELKVSPAVQVAKKLIPELKKKSDFVIALTHQGLEADQVLARSVKGIDVIIGAHSQSFLQDTIQEGSTRIYQSSFRNQYVGVLPIEMPFKNTGHQLIGLDPVYDEPKEPGAQIRKIAEKSKEEIAALNSKEEKPKLSTISSAKHSKFQTFARCSECHLKQFDFWRKTSHANALHPLVQQNQHKNKLCLSCHTVGLNDPKGFQNVQSLAEKKSASDLPTREAISIPTEDLSEYLKSIHEASTLQTPVKITRDDTQPVPVWDSLSKIQHAWAPVQCENCHGPGENHPFSAQPYPEKVENTTCLKCHTAERAPQWYTRAGQPDWEKISQKRVLITCPAGDLTEVQN